MRYFSMKFFSALMIVISLAMVPLALVTIRQDGKITVQLKEDDLIVDNFDIRLTFSKMRGYTLAEFVDDQENVNLIHYAAFYVYICITTKNGDTRSYTDINDNDASINIIKYSSSQVILKTNTRLVSDDGQRLDGVKVSKIFGVRTGRKEIDAQVTVQFNSTILTINWIKVGVFCTNYLSRWTYGVFTYLNDQTYYLSYKNGSLSGMNAYAYLLPNLKWMATYNPMTNVSLTLTIMNPEQFMFNNDKNGTRMFGTWDGVHSGISFSAIEAFWSIPDEVKEEEFITVDLQLVLRSINNQALNC